LKKALRNLPKYISGSWIEIDGNALLDKVACVCNFVS